jgi:hypothetical protein
MYSRGLLFGTRARRAFFRLSGPPARARVMQIKRASGSRLYLLFADTALGEKCVKLPFARAAADAAALPIFYMIFLRS